MVLLHETKPYSSPAPNQQNENDFTDFFAKAHAQSDLNNGLAALHHTLDQPGGGAKFNHQHGDLTVHPIVLWGTGGSVNPGSGGLSRVICQKLSRELVWIQFYMFFGTATGKVVRNMWYYDWTSGGNAFFYKDAIMPVGFTVSLPASYTVPVGTAGPGEFHGKLSWDYQVQIWYWMWDSGPNGGTFNPSTNGQLTGDTTGWPVVNGAVGSQFNTISAQGVYQCKGVI